jgi:preprotein translocase subunit SecE
MAENENIELTAQAGIDKAEKAEKAKKTEKKASKPSIFDRVLKWCKEMKSELKKVQWPTRKQTINNTLIVIACVVIVGVFIWVFDFVAGNAIELLISLLS